MFLWEAICHKRSREDGGLCKCANGTPEKVLLISLQKHIPQIKLSGTAILYTPLPPTDLVQWVSWLQLCLYIRWYQVECLQNILLPNFCQFFWGASLSERKSFCLYWNWLNGNECQYPICELQRLISYLKLKLPILSVTWQLDIFGFHLFSVTGPIEPPICRSKCRPIRLNLGRH